MSTLQHTLQPALRNRVAVILMVAAMAAAAVIAIVASNGGSSSSLSSSPDINVQPSSASLQQQLESSAGPRYGQVSANGGVIGRATPPTKAQLKRELEAAAGPRYGQHVGFQTQR
jgi:hypothetical protein